jgi:teichuronic acid biosynthesis glycosyltransferase TuaH
MKVSARVIARDVINRYLSDPVQYVLWMNSIEELSVALARELAPLSYRRIFDSSDDFVEFESADVERAKARQSLATVLRLTDRVIAVNEHLLGKLEHSQKRVFHNCTDFQNFQQRLSDWSLRPYIPKPQGTKYIGYVGGLLNLRADFELLQLLFVRFPAYQFLFVGYTNSPSIGQWLKQYPNVAFIPEVPYDRLPTIIRTFDVAIIPHLDNENTRGNDLLKLLDYFSCGVPIVSTRCSNVENYKDACWIADSHEEFAALIERLTKGDLLHDPALGLQIARERSWEYHVPSLLAWIE